MSVFREFISVYASTRFNLSRVEGDAWEIKRAESKEKESFLSTKSWSFNKELRRCRKRHFNIGRLWIWLPREYIRRNTLVNSVKYFGVRSHTDTRGLTLLPSFTIVTLLFPSSATERSVRLIFRREGKKNATPETGTWSILDCSTTISFKNNTEWMSNCFRRNYFYQKSIIFLI